jgi:hypothetical protein
MTAAGQCWELPTLEHRISGTGSGLWPTPNAGDCKQTGNVDNWKRRQAEKAAHGINLQLPLAVAVKFATPLSRDWRSGKASQATHDKNSRPLSEQIGGSLNPTWVEWLMGWPLGWTDLKPLATGKCRSVPQPRGQN